MRFCKTKLLLKRIYVQKKMTSALQSLPNLSAIESFSFRPLFDILLGRFLFGSLDHEPEAYSLPPCTATLFLQPPSTARAPPATAPIASVRIP